MSKILPAYAAFPTANADEVDSETLLSAVMSAFNGFVYTCGPDYRITYHNGAMKERIGRDATGEFCFQALHDRVSVCPWCVNTRVFAGETVRGVGQSPKDERWFEVCSAPIWKNGEVIAKVGMFTDITDRKQAEAEIISLNASLNDRVRERTEELESAIREQESFSYSVSHDLRAPLRHINSFSAILIEEFGAVVPDDARRYLERIVDATSKMGHLIDSLLNLSRVARTEMTREAVDLGELAAVIVAGLMEAEPRRRVEFRMGDRLQVQGDRALLRQMLTNLLENAWKYSALKPEASIEVGKTTVGGKPTFYVKDNGAGFDMAYSDKLFSIFQRIHGNEFEGTGIGLATAHKIVKRHGGSIWAESKVDRGATFYFTIP
jgi:signal transduction histidine kinase